MTEWDHSRFSRKTREVKKQTDARHSSQAPVKFDNHTYLHRPAKNFVHPSYAKVDRDNDYLVCWSCF